MRVMFCGHSEVSQAETIRAWLRTVTDELIAEGANVFYLGGYGAFDSLAISVLREQKERHADIQLILVLAYLDRQIDASQYDQTVYPPLESVPRRFAISKRNEWMVDSSDVAVAYVTHGWGGAATTLAYAKRKKKRIIQYPIEASVRN